MSNASLNDLIIVYYRNAEIAQNNMSIKEINKLDEKKGKMVSQNVQFSLIQFVSLPHWWK